MLRYKASGYAIPDDVQLEFVQDDGSNPVTVTVRELETITRDFAKSCRAQIDTLRGENVRPIT